MTPNQRTLALCPYDSEYRMSWAADKRYVVKRIRRWGVWPVTKIVRDRWHQRKSPWGSVSEFAITVFGIWSFPMFKVEGAEFDYPRWIRRMQGAQRWIFCRDWACQTTTVLGLTFTREFALNTRWRWLTFVLTRLGGWQ